MFGAPRAEAKKKKQKMSLAEALDRQKKEAEARAAASSETSALFAADSWGSRTKIQIQRKLSEEILS